jgi:SPP1 family predicted phage head-tail adaptor
MAARTGIAAGDLRHRITIARPNLTQDTFGGTQIGDDSIFADRVPASIATLTGRELYAAQQKVSEVTHRIVIRWMRGVTAKMNVVWTDENRFFQIQAVENPDGRHIDLHLLCIERDDSARNV